jgi:hypothetical protein
LTIDPADWAGFAEPVDDIGRIAERLGRPRDDVAAAVGRLRDAGRFDGTGGTMDKARQQLRGLFRHATRSRITDDDLRQYGIPDDARRIVSAECEDIYELRAGGDRPGADRAALEAARKFAEHIGDRLGPLDMGDARADADAILRDRF